MIESIAALMGQGAWAQAKEESKKLIDQRPTMAEAHAYLGICLYHESNFEEALKSFQRATTLNPHYWQAGTKLVQCLDRLQRFEEAYEAALHWQNEAPSDRTLQSLVNGLSHHVSGKSHDSWQKSTKPMFHNVQITRGE